MPKTFTVSISGLPEWRDLTEEQSKELGDTMLEFWRSGRIEWHCEGRHGVVRGVYGKEARIAVTKAIIYFMGLKSYWWNGNDVEFVTMTKVFPPPKRPWQWCGTTLLFEDWKNREEDRADALDTFNLGTKVSFTYKDIRYVGTIINKRKRATIYVEGVGKFYMPPEYLTRV